MGHHELLVGGDADVEFERVHADAQGALEGHHGVLRGQAARAAVALQVEAAGRRAAGGRLAGGHRGAGRQGGHGEGGKEQASLFHGVRLSQVRLW